jgi:hypothetical protein
MSIRSFIFSVAILFPSIAFAQSTLSPRYNGVTANTGTFGSATISGGVSAGSLSISGSGSTGDVSGMSVTATGGNTARANADRAGALLTPADFGTLYADGQQATCTSTVSAGSTALAISGCSITAADIGKVIRIAQSGGTLNATIAAVPSAGQVTLSAGAQIALSGVSAPVFWGHDDYPALQAALNSGKPISAPAAAGTTYWISQTLTFPAKTVFVGPGRDVATIKLMPGVNADVMTATGSYSLFGTNSGSSIDGWRIQGIALDGNRSAQFCSNPDTCNGLAAYSAGFKLVDVRLNNVVGHCLRTDYQQFGGGGGLVDTVAGLTCGRHGWYNAGPHDVSAVQVGFVDASQEADNTYSGMYTTRFSTGKYHRMHNWHQGSATNRVAFQLNDTTGGLVIENSQFEGGRQQANFGGNNSICIGCKLYAPFGVDNTSLLVFSGSGNQFQSGSITATDGQSYYAIKMGDTSAVFGNQVVGTYISGFSTKGPFNFANDGGYNSFVGVSGAAASSGASTITGTMHKYSKYEYTQSGTSINLRTSGFNGNVIFGGNNNLTVGSGGAAHSVVIGGDNNSTGSASDACAIGGQGLTVSNFAGCSLGGQTVTNGAAFGGTVGGGTINFSGSYSGTVGAFAVADRGRYGFQNITGAGRFSVTGDAQSGTQMLRASATSTTAVRLTSNNSTADGANCVNIPDNTAYSLRISLIVRSVTTPANSYAWTMPVATLLRGTGAASTTLTPGTAATVSTGSFTPTVSATADTTNGCLNLSVTPPAGNTDTIHAVARVDSVEVQ